LSDLVESVELTLTIHESGRLERVSFPRWNSDANNGPIGVLEFVMIAADRERTFGGITLPERFEAGWASADGSTTPFFSAEIRSAAFR
jgi:hypothetical protein